MNVEDLKSRLEELKQQINYHNERYYNDDAPEIEDFEYDKLLRDLEDLENAHPELITKDSPTQNVGGKKSSKFDPVVHEVQMGSLHDSFSEEELMDFDRKVRSVVSNPVYVVEPKFDGLSVSLEYRDGVFVRGSTRGDGLVGEDITENLMTIKTIPKRLKRDIPFIEVRAEVYMSKSSFFELLKKQEINEEKPFKNPRNAAAGSLRQKDAKITKERNLDAFVFNIQRLEGKKVLTHIEALKLMTELGFKVSSLYESFDNIEGVIDKIKEIGDVRGELPYQIDGAVVKVNSFEHRNMIGSTSKFPKWAEAYKYPPEEKETELLDIEVNVGRTGVLTPIGVFKPIFLSGSTVSRATLHNEDFIKEKEISIGDIAVLRKAGDIIPEVVSIKEHKEGSSVYKMPEFCPSCGSPVERLQDEAAIRCPNTDCPAQLLRHLVHFVSRDAMDIDGLGVAVLEQLLENKLISSPSDLYKLKKEDISQLERMGDKSSENLINSIAKSKDNDLYRFIFALGIRHIGLKAAKLLSEKFKDIDNIFSATREEIASIDGYGDIMAKAVFDYFSLKDTKTLIDKFRSYNVNMKEKEKDREVKFEGLTFVLTGTLPNYKRSEAANIIEKLGGKVSSSVSKKTSYVLTGDEAGSKLKKANELGVKVIDENEFIKMCEN